MTLAFLIMIQNLVLFLIGFPALAALILAGVPNNNFRNRLVWVFGLIILVVSVVLVVGFGSISSEMLSFHSKALEKVMFYGEWVMSLLILVLSIKHKKLAPLFLVVIQTSLLTWFELGYGHQLEAANNLFVDKLSLVMALIIGVIGSLICIYAVGYMKEFHEKQHPEIKDRRALFFFILFFFLSAMFGIVFSNNLMWLFFFWEVTTLSSFLLIGYKQNEESINNAFRAVFMNLFGGVFFAMAIIYLFLTTNTIELNQMLGLGGLVMLPVVFLSIAGMTKAAQMPFSSWLLGAMVAPTPVSALLHSSTMVKAGVYLLIRVAPLLGGTLAGLLVACVGGVTFIITSFIAISQSDAKKVLAYSTIANLGLIVMCSGIGTPAAIWAAILLVIFHAIAKGLLFLSVGVVEHKLHSRDIESMDNLIIKMPRLAWMLLVGMAGMFLAPFGMLISKWAVLKALVDANPGLTVVLIYGSAATLFFWVKWMGKILAVVQPEKTDETGISRSEWTALYALVTATIAVCLTFPLISRLMIEPFVFGSSTATTILTRGNSLIMIIMMGFVILFRFSLPKKDEGERIVETYLSGLNVDQRNAYSAPLGATKSFISKNYYLSKYFGEKNLSSIGVATSWLIVMLLIGSSLPWLV